MLVLCEFLSRIICGVSFPADDDVEAKPSDVVLKLLSQSVVLYWRNIAKTSGLKGNSQKRRIDLIVVSAASRKGKRHLLITKLIYRQFEENAINCYVPKNQPLILEIDFLKIVILKRFCGSML